MQFSISCTGTCLKTVYHTVMKLNFNWHVVNHLNIKDNGKMDVNYLSTLG